jgi:hypothetical protein
MHEALQCLDSITKARSIYDRQSIIGCPAGVEAEAELLAAITSFFSRVGLSSGDVGIKVSSRKVLAAVLERYQVPPENFAQVRFRVRCAAGVGVVGLSWGVYGSRCCRT